MRVLQPLHPALEFRKQKIQRGNKKFTNKKNQITCGLISHEAVVWSSVSGPRSVHLFAALTESRRYYYSLATHRGDKWRYSSAHAISGEK